jgi:hypothetical protein
MTLSEAGAATSAEASGAKNVGSPHVKPIGAPVATPVCVVTEPVATTDCGKDSMQLAVSATTSYWASGTNSTKTFPDPRGEVQCFNVLVALLLFPYYITSKYSPQHLLLKDPQFM